MSTVALELHRRGHLITWAGTLDFAEQVQQWGFKSVVMGRDEFPLGYIAETMAKLGKMSGVSALRFTLAQYAKAIRVGLEETPDILREHSVDAILADESAFHAGSLADLLELPFISIASALPIHPDPHHPPSGPGWSYGTTPYHLLRNYLGKWMIRLLMRPIAQSIRQFRREHGLAPKHLIRDNASRLATIVQITPEFDFPRREVPRWFHYVGSLQQSAARSPVSFPFEQIDDERSLIYASMGTLQNRLYPIFGKIAEACSTLPVQLVISLGGGGQASDIGRLAGDPLVVDYAPQLELLERSTAVVTHAGMNTTTECLAAGVPMLAIPVTNDQPAVAARIKRAGCGLVVPLKRISVALIRSAITRLLEDASFRDNASRLGAANAHAGGMIQAVEIIESVLE